MTNRSEHFQNSFTESTPIYHVLSLVWFIAVFASQDPENQATSVNEMRRASLLPVTLSYLWQLSAIGTKAGLTFLRKQSYRKRQHEVGFITVEMYLQILLLLGCYHSILVMHYPVLKFRNSLWGPKLERLSTTDRKLWDGCWERRRLEVMKKLFREGLSYLHVVSPWESWPNIFISIAHCLC